MAPEQMAGGRVGPRTDLWSLGAVLYQAITGRVPFDGGSPLAIASQQREGSPALQGVDPSLASIVVACLSYDVAARPLDAGALATALRGWLDGTVSEATTRTLLVPAAPAAAASPAPAAAAPAGRRRGRVAIPVAAAVLGLVLLGGMVASGLGPEAARAPAPTATPRATPDWTAALLADYREACGEPLDREEVDGMTRAEAEADVSERIGECRADAAEEADEDDGPGKGNGRGKGKDNGKGKGNGGEDGDD
jgi:hypothetical protein